MIASDHSCYSLRWCENPWIIVESVLGWRLRVPFDILRLPGRPDRGRIAFQICEPLCPGIRLIILHRIYRRCQLEVHNYHTLRKLLKMNDLNELHQTIDPREF